jgi:hypothetical protein
MYASGVGTTTIRVDSETHAQLIELSRASGASLIDTVREAAQALRRQRFGARVAVELDRLHADPAAWQGYLEEADSASVLDGLG